MRTPLVSAVSVAAFGFVIFACGSEDGREALPEGTSGGPTSNKVAEGGVFASTSSGGPGATTGGPTGSERCTDTANALEGCGCPTDGAEAPCWSGPTNLRKVGGCKDGTAKCIRAGEFLRWGACTGETLPGSQGLDASCQSTCKGECVPGKWRYCDEAQFCAWGKQDCLPNGQGGGSWGPCKETQAPSGCEPIISFPGFPAIYDEDCCKQKGFCCQVGGVNSPKSEGNCAGIVTTCQ